MKIGITFSALTAALNAVLITSWFIAVAIAFAAIWTAVLIPVLFLALALGLVALLIAVFAMLFTVFIMFFTVLSAMLFAVLAVAKGIRLTTYLGTGFTLQCFHCWILNYEVDART